MPELPEVETVVRSVRPHLLGHTIEHARVSSHRVTRQNHAATAGQLQSTRIDAVRRRGKQILIDLTCPDQSAALLYVHLGMTGKLLWIPEGEPLPAHHVHATLAFMHGQLAYQDPRMFGRFEFYPAPPPLLEAVGPDALTISLTEFSARLRRHRGAVKAVLLNQHCLSGVGNIYADESLWAARIHPKARVQRLSNVRLARLHSALIAILEAAVNARGSSIADYVDGAGNRGSYQQQHNVYGKGGDECARCQSLIRKIVLAQRGTHYCPQCQRA